MALLDRDGKIHHASTAFCDILGYRRSELAGLGLSEITHSDDSETEAEQRKRLRSSEIDRYQLVERLIRKDGAAAWVLLFVSVCRRASGFPEYYVVRVENAGRHVSIGDRAAPDALAHYVGEAVHEIGNTLTPLMVSTQLIVEQSKTGDISDSAQVIFNAARRIAWTLRRLRGIKDLQRVAIWGRIECSTCARWPRPKTAISEAGPRRTLPCIRNLRRFPPKRTSSQTASSYTITS